MERKIERAAFIGVFILALLMAVSMARGSEYTWEEMEAETTCNPEDVRPADIIVYRPAFIQIAGGKFPTEIFEKRCGEEIQFHADLYAGDDWLMTSTPGQGCGAVSKLSSRLESGTWTKWWVYRNESLTDAEINAILSYADRLECNYDWIGYNEWLIQMVCSCGEKRHLTGLWNTIQEILPPALRTYHCVSSTLESFNVDPKAPLIPKPHNTIPTDLLGLGFALKSVCEIE